MKKTILGSLLLLTTAIAFSQEPERREGPRKPPPLPERWRHDSTVIVSATGVSKDQSSKLKTVFYSFYKEMDELVEKNMQKRPSKEEVEKIAAKRNDAAKKFLSKEQAQKFDNLKRELMPPPPGEKKAPPPANT
jgi:hypothetical protein